MRLVRQGIMKWVEKDRLRVEIRDAYRILFGKPEVMRLIGETKMCMIRCGLDSFGSGYVRVMGVDACLVRVLCVVR
jgi:hypothetical protein